MNARHLDRAGPAEAGPDTVRFTFAPRPENVSLARLVAAAMAARHGLGAESVEDVRLIVSEACTNAVRAQQRKRIDRPISVTCTCDGAFLVEVEDAGGGIDDTPLPNDPGEGGGYGIPIMRRIADRATFDSGSGGTRVRLTVAIPRNGHGGDR